MRAATAMSLVVLILGGPVPLGLSHALDVPPNVRVTTLQGPANEVHIAVNPLDPQQLLAGAKDYTLGPSSACGVTRVWAGAYASSDGGRSWSNALLPGHSQNAITPLTPFGCSTDPVVAWDGRGRAHFAGLAYEGPDESSMLYLATSLDGGLTWPLIVPVHAMDGQVWFNDKEWLAVDPVTGTAYVSWTVFPRCSIPLVGCPGPGGIVIARCLLGLACTPPEPLTLPNDACSGIVQASYPAIGRDGTVHVVWWKWDLFTGFREGRICYTRSLGPGGPFLPPVTVAAVVNAQDQPNTDYRTPMNPALAVDRNDTGNLYVAWHDARFDASDVLLARSVDGGATWSAPVRVNDDAPGASNFMPAVGVAPNGRVDVAFYDRRDDPANRLLTTYLASSYDGGLTWVNLRTSEAQFDGELSRHQAGAPFIGDYIGVASTEAAAIPIWTDTRHGRGDAYVAIVPR